MSQTTEFLKQPEKKIRVEKSIKGDKRNKILLAKEHLEQKYDIRLNQDTKEVEWKLKSEKAYNLIDDQTFGYFKMDILMQAGITLTKDDLDILLSSGYFFETYHPFKDYLAKLPKWDGKTDYFAEWCRQVQVKGEDKYCVYFIEGFKKWFVGMVMSLITDEVSPRNVNQICMVFTGKEGKYKSTFFNNLIPADMRSRYFYTGTYDFHSEEAQKYLGTKILIDLAELEALNRGEITQIKARITQQQVSLRLKYGRKDTNWKRRASFCGSTNDQNFLTSVTGNRRFIIIPIERITIDETLNLDNLYAQALALYKNGFQYWLDEDEINTVNLMNNEFRRTSEAEEMILLHLKKPLKDDYEHPGRVDYMNATMIANWLTETYKRLNVNDSLKKKIGEIMNLYEFPKVKKRVNDSPYPIDCYAVIKYRNPQLTNINNNNFESKNIDDLI